ncbi:hypothetical protein CROQUDRAFT_147885 [Cronartium quercuum f. sp. fusiforme G11]|uniref:Uncharacterized protein n=1 Tax=Cronartium quercuum f. sp. fusiforme G11 TaxID=708437 RepID=A0A9P6TJ72_9BASI|nr:hypothetical protein CROQUDRAFT_147885 [Cronartium quercuum f. sp. fusiforme G11]
MFFTKPGPTSLPIRPLEYTLVPKILASPEVESLALLSEIGIDRAIVRITEVSDSGLQSLASVCRTCQRYIDECNKPLRLPGSSTDRNTLKEWGMADLSTLSSHVNKLIEQAHQARSYLDSRFQKVRALESGASKADMKHDEVKRLLRAYNDPGYSKVIGSRQLGPVQLARQKNMRRLTRDIKLGTTQVSVALQHLKTRLSNIKSGRRQIQPPFLDTINRSIHNITHALTHHIINIRQLNSRVQSLQSMAAKAEGKRVVSELGDSISPAVGIPETTKAFTERVALQALQNEHTGVRFKDAILSQQRRPILTSPEGSSRPENSALSHILPAEPIIMRPRDRSLSHKSSSSYVPQSPTWFRKPSPLAAPRKSLETSGLAHVANLLKQSVPSSEIAGFSRLNQMTPPHPDRNLGSATDRETDPSIASDTSDDSSSAQDGNAQQTEFNQTTAKQSFGVKELEKFTLLMPLDHRLRKQSPVAAPCKSLDPIGNVLINNPINTLISFGKLGGPSGHNQALSPAAPYRNVKFAVGELVDPQVASDLPPCNRDGEGQQTESDQSIQERLAEVTRLKKSSSLTPPSHKLQSSLSVKPQTALEPVGTALVTDPTKPLVHSTDVVESTEPAHSDSDVNSLASQEIGSSVASADDPSTDDEEGEEDQEGQWTESDQLNPELLPKITDSETLMSLSPPGHMQVSSTTPADSPFDDQQLTDAIEPEKSLITPGSMQVPSPTPESLSSGNQETTLPVDPDLVEHDLTTLTTRRPPTGQEEVISGAPGTSEAASEDKGRSDLISANHDQENGLIELSNQTQADFQSTLPIARDHEDSYLNEFGPPNAEQPVKATEVDKGLIPTSFCQVSVSTMIPNDSLPAKQVKAAPDHKNPVENDLTPSTFMSTTVDEEGSSALASDLLSKSLVDDKGQVDEITASQMGEENGLIDSSRPVQVDSQPPLSTTLDDDDGQLDKSDHPNEEQVAEAMKPDKSIPLTLTESLSTTLSSHPSEEPETAIPDDSNLVMHSPTTPAAMSPPAGAEDSPSAASVR